MAPKRTGKKAAGLAQPTLAFSAQRKSSLNAGKPKAAAAALRASASASSSIAAERDDASAVVHEIKPDARAAGAAAVAKADVGGARLDPADARWRPLYEHAKKEMGAQPVHAGPETHNAVHHILRVFDMTAKYGPSVGRTRLERWERASKLGLDPPPEIKLILTTTEGKADAAYRENVLHQWLG